jgi:Ca2+-transporting ATPase
VTVVVSDKTGTLTENRLRLVATRPAAGRTERELLAAATLASTVSAVGDGKERRIVGDPVDVAIAVAAHHRGIDPAALLRERRLAEERPFDPVSKRMTLVYEEDGALHAYTKGAPEVVLARSAGNGEERERLLKLAQEWAAQGLRVLAVAEGHVRARAGEDEWERQLQPAGLVALEDPLRETARSAIAEARAAGIRVEVLTGDHPATARAIGRALALPEEAVHARVTPAEKLRFVEELQRAGEVVAVTGDGVNDAPALRRADVGIAMGTSGTEAAREAADVVLTDDDFATIIAAIREGRRIASNVRKFVAFLLSANMGEVALFAVAIPAGLGAPMTVVQVLTINLLTDGPPAVALARDPPSPDIMRQSPQRGTRLFALSGWGALAVIGLLVGLAALAAFLVGRSGGDDQAQTMAFATIALAELALVFSLRSPVNPAWETPRNPYLAASVAVSAILIAAAIYVPALNAPLGTVPLDFTGVGTVAVLALAPVALVEAGKAGSRRLRGNPQPAGQI